MEQFIFAPTITRSRKSAVHYVSVLIVSFVIALYLLVLPMQLTRGELHFLASPAHAQTEPVQINYDAATGSASVTGAGSTGIISTTGFTRGAGVVQATGGTFNSSNWNETNLNAAISADDYIAFSVTVAPGFALDIAQIQMRLDRSATGPPNWELQYSLDGFATQGTLLAGSGTYGVIDDASGTNYDLSPLSLSGLTGAIAFRLYAWGASSFAGTMDFETHPTTGYGLAISGAVAPVNTTVLDLVKVVNNPAPLVGEPITFTVAITNVSAVTATNITVTDVVQSGFIYQAGSMGGGDGLDEGSAPALLWSVSQLEPGASTNLSFRARVNTSGVYTNVATVDAANSASTINSPLITVTPRIPQVTLSASPQINEGQSGVITATLDIAPALDVTVTLAYTDGTAGGSDYTPANTQIVIPAGSTTGTTTVSTVDDTTNEPDETFEVGITDVQNGMNISSPQVITIMDNDAPPTTLRVIKEASSYAVAAGDLITFTVHISNTGAITATNVSITDVVQSGFTYQAGSISGGTSSNETGAPTLLWTVNSLRPGDATDVSFRATVNATGIYTNAAVADAPEAFAPAISAPVTLFLLPTCRDASMESILDWDQSGWAANAADGSPDQPSQTFSYNGRSYTLAWLPGANGGTPTTRTSSFHPDLATIGIAGGLDQTFTWQLTFNDGPMAHVQTSLHDFDRTRSGNTVKQEQVTIRGFNGATPVAPAVYPTVDTGGVPVILYHPDGSATVYGQEDNSDVEIYFASAIDRIEYEVGWGPDSEAVLPNYTITTRDLSSCADFGDAPDSYGTLASSNGAMHYPLTDGPILGSTVDTDSNGFGDGTDDSGAALDDDNEDVSDEEGIATFPTLTPATTSYSVDVAVRNAGTTPATLIGWIDFNADGAFAASEAATALVNPGTPSGVETLTWNSPIMTNTGGVDTYARFRITTDPSVNVATPGGAALDGEVEDYALPIEPLFADLVLEKRVNNSAPRVGEVITFTLVVTNNGPAPATNVAVTDVVQSGFTYQAGSISGPGADESGAPVLRWLIPLLDNGLSQILSFRVGVNGTGVYTNTASASSPDAPSWAVSPRVVVTPVDDLVINEIDYDQPGADDAEFVELLNREGTAVALDGYELHLINDTGASYQVVDLNGQEIPAGGYLVICSDVLTVPNCDLDAITSIQNGSADAVALVRGGVTVDAVSYEGDAPGYTEGSGSGLVDNGSEMDVGLSRLPNGTDTNQNNLDFSPRCITPGAANTERAASCGIPIVTLSATPAVTEGVSGMITATLDVTSTQDVTVTLVYTDGTADGADYTITAMTMVIPAGQTSTSIPFGTVDDAVDEADETFRVGIASVQNGTDGSTPQTVTILDNDEPVAPTVPMVTLSATPAVTEGVSGMITATLDVTSTQDVTVTLVYTDSTADGADYTITAVTMVIPAGQTSASIPFDTVDDAVDEADETFGVGIASVQNGTDGSTPQTVIILDNDEPVVPTVPMVTLSATPAVTEGVSGMITATLDVTSTQDVTVTLVYTDSTADGANYTITAVTMVIPAGQTSASIPFGTVDDAVDEVDETFEVGIASVQNGTDGSTPQTVTILDNDEPVAPTVPISGVVWHDVNGDGVRQESEPFIASAEVALCAETDGAAQGATSNCSVVMTTTTNATGEYSFTDVSPGSYYIEFTGPDELVPTHANQGADEMRDSDAERISLMTMSHSEPLAITESGASVVIDAGFVEPAVITSIIYVDGNQNNQYDDGELLVPNAIVILYDEKGDEVARTVANENGLYTFEALTPGTYEVDVVPPPGYQSSINTRSRLIVQSGETEILTVSVFTPTALDLINEPKSLDRYIYLPVLAK